MYLSLKWKAVAFLSLVLITLTGVWVGQHIYKAISTYDNRVADLDIRQQAILDQLLDDNFLRLSQLSQLIAEMPEIQTANKSGADEIVQRYLRREWIKLNINTGIDFIGLYSLEGQKIGSAFSQLLFQNQEELHEAIDDAMVKGGMQFPRSFLFCGFGCSQFVIEPFVLTDGSEALVVTGQNIAEIIQRYQQVSSNDLAVLLPDLPYTDFPASGERSLEGWDRRLWAASRFQGTLAQLQHAQQSTTFAELDHAGSLEFEDQRLLLNPLKPSGYDTYGQPPEVIAISDQTQQHQNLVNSVKISVLIGALALLVSEMILILIMLNPLRRLFSVVEALNLLPKHKYQQAEEKLQVRTGLLQDELTLLEKSTRSVTRELEALHIEVEDQNESLQEQIAVVTRSRAFLERLIDSSHLFIVTQELDGTILSCNARFENEFRRPIADFFELFIQDDSRKLFQERVTLLTDNHCEVFQLDAEFANDQGLPIYLDWTCSIVEDEKGRDILLAIGIDLTQRKRDEEALEWLANNDPLTGIGNRRGFQHDLQKVLDTQRNGAVVFIDVNRFKQINDLYGHTIGDHVLIQIAESLRASVRSTDSISRLAGDEFTVVLPNINRDQLGNLLQKLSTQLSGQLPLDGEERSVEYSVSVGAALIPHHGDTEQDLIVHADMAMYQAKKKGGGQWQIFDPSTNDLADIRRDHDLTSLLKQALKRSDLFELNYQPIFSIKNETVSHYEVLLRLKDLEGNPVYPSDFIPAAERMGLIRLVDEWVMDKSLEKLAATWATGDLFSLSINISAPTLQSSTFPEILIGLIRKYRVEPSYIIIELTETAYIENFQMVLTNLERISEVGVLVALDDFGVGFSSFSYLKKLPLSYVKLDGSYIRDLENNTDNQVFVESLNKMVNAFGMHTIAEFVEDEITLRKLEELGVDYAQGYYIGKPSPKLSEMVAGAGFEPTTFGL